VKTNSLIFSSAENFDPGLEIYETFLLVIGRLHSKFWHSLKHHVEELMRQAPGEFENWRCDCDLTKRDLQSNYFDICLAPKTAPSSTLHCFPRLLQENANSKFQLFYGISCNQWIGSKEPPRIPEFEALKRQVREVLKLTNTYGGSWVGGTYELHGLRDSETLRQLARDDSLEHLLAAQFIELFKETRRLLESANGALSRK
jgi:hypothetical protein